MTLIIDIFKKMYRFRLPFILVYVFWVLLCRPVSGVSEKVYKFDFGPEESKVFPGFGRMTKDVLYSRGRGYGWLAKGGRRHFDREYYDDLCRDLVWVRSSTFSVDLPDGRYIVHFWIGDLYDLIDYLRFGISIEGQEFVKAREVSFEEYSKIFFMNIGYVYSRGDSVWEKLISPRFIPESFYVTVSDGRLDIELRNCRLNALMIYPAEQHSTSIDEVLSVNRKRRQQFENEWTSLEPKRLSQHNLGRQAKQKGYVLFSHHWMERVYPDTAVENGTGIDNLKVSCARSEWEPVSFCIYALDHLKDVEISVSDLTTESGAKLAGSNIGVRMGKYRFTTQEKKRRRYRPREDDIVEFDKIDISAEVTTRCWLDVYVPEQTKPGIYKGVVEVKPANAPSSSFTLEVEVYPFKLLRDAKWHNYSLQYIHPSQYKYHPEHSSYWDYLKKDYLFMKKLGLGLPTLGYDRNSKPKVIWDRGKKNIIKMDFSNLERTMSVYKNIGGFDCPNIIYCFYHLTVSGYGMKFSRAESNLPASVQEPYFWRNYKQIVKAVRDKQIEEGWPEFIFLCTAEMTNKGPDCIRYGAEILRVLREIPYIKLATMANGMEELETLAPYADIVGIASKMCKDKVLAKTRALAGQRDIWVYWDISRFGNGFYHYKSKAKGAFREDYQHTFVDPYNSFDGHIGETGYNLGLVFPSPEGPVPTKRCYIYREGVDDARYLYTLEVHILKAKQSDSEEAVLQARRSEEVLGEIMEQITTDLASYRMNRIPHLDGSTYDKFRKQISDEIKKLIQCCGQII